MTEEHIAIHEAGHAVAHMRLFPVGRYLGVASIVPGEGYSGRFASEPLEFPLDVDEDILEQAVHKEAVCFCAGYAALIAAGYDEDTAAAGCGDDFSKAEECFRQDLRAVKTEAVKLMARPENVKAVRLIADELLKRKRIFGDLLYALLDLSDGESTEVEFKRYELSREGVCCDE